MTAPLNAAQAVDHLRALYAPDPAIARLLPDVGDGLAAQCANLARDPTPHGCELLAANLNGAARFVLRLREGLLAEGGAE
jgi:hypothetical protein